MTSRTLAALTLALVSSLALPGVAAAVTVSPAPDTPTASFRTQLSFRGAAPGELGTIRVTGSRSGTHQGRLRAHSDGRGASLVFREAFRRGERVSVSTSLDIAGARDGDYSFKVVGLRNAAAIQVFPDPPNAAGAGPRQRFRSRPDLIPPRTSETQRRDGLGTGKLFLNTRNRSSLGQQGPVVLDEAGDLVYFKAVAGRRRATDVRVQSLGGRPVLTWWEGNARQGGGSGEGVVVDQGYRPVARVRAGNGYRLDLHEFLLTPQNTALVLVYNPIARDLTELGGSSDGRVVDSIVQEIDLATGLVLFEWHSIGNVGLAESYSRPTKNAALYFDYFHVNSVVPDADGNLLISGRDTWSVLKIDRGTGGTIWRMGGKRSSFRMDPAARFAYQHDAERRPDGTITLFDNSAAPPVKPQSRALVLRMDEAARRVRLERAYTHPRRLLAANQGSMQTLPNGNVLIGWGSQRRYSEHAPDGRLLYDGALSIANDSYRVERSPWAALPRDGRPALAAEARGSGRTAVYASFNGATEVARWEVLAGRTRTALAPVAASARTGFETAISAPNAGPFFQVRALDAAGAVLGTSLFERRG